MKDVLKDFDEYLTKNNLQFEAVIIGAGALIVMDVITRKTKDIDCLDPRIPDEIKKASEDFAKKYPKFKLFDDWLNNGPESLIRELDKSWRKNCVTIFKGKSLNLSTLGRQDLLNSKLFAYCDRAQDLGDCIALKPTELELKTGFAWVKERDANPDWPEHVKTQFKVLAEKVGVKFNE